MTIRDISQVIKTGKGTLGQDSLAGGILKVLSEAGFSEKIARGVEQGHEYRVLHANGESNFVLIDRWQEKTGAFRTQYYPFMIRSGVQEVSQKQETLADPVSQVLDRFEESLDEFLSFAA